jgi:hypothetical protein
MKKIILVLTIGLLLLSCSSDSNSSTSSGLYKWSFKLDGVLYQWSGNQLTGDSSGASTFAGSNFAGVSNGNPLVSLTIAFPNVSTGNFTFNSSTTSYVQIGIVTNSTSSSQYITTLGGTINVNISSLSSNTFVTNPSNPGKVIGTFSGTISSVDGNTVTITEGSFEALRAQ